LCLDAAMGFLAPPPAPFAEDGTYLGDDWRDPEHEREARAHKEQILAETPGGTVGAAAAVAWAAEAGLTPGSVEDVAEALDGHDVFVEDVFFRLLNRLGIATDEVETPRRPALAEVLRSLIGHRLAAVDTVAHRPTRGERLTGDMPDMRLHFEDQPTVTACSCAGEFGLLPPITNPAAKEAPPVDESQTHAVAAVAGRELTNAATVRHRYLPFVRGVVLRFGERGLFIVAIDGAWTVAEGWEPPRQLRDALGPDRKDEIYVNPWLVD
jgi:hypothetical protein